MESKRYNILMVHNYYQIPGGEDVVVANEKKMLESRGHQVTLYTRHNEEIRGMNYLQKLKLPFISAFSFRTYRDIKRIIREQRIDIVHVHNTLSLISPSVYYAAQKCGVPVIQTVHNFRFLCPGALFFRNGRTCEDCVKKGLSCAVRHKCYSNSRLQTLICVFNTWYHRHTGILNKLYFICLTKFNKEKLLTLPQIREGHVFVKPNFTKPVAISQEQIHTHSNQFVYVGRLDEYKGIGTLLEAWKQYERKHLDERLLICGKGDREEWCREFIKANGLSGVEMLGQVSHEKVFQVMATSKALIMPTQVYEGFALTVIEAFSVGTPVICSDMGNVGALVDAGKTGYKFASDDADGLLRAMEQINESPISVDTVKGVYASKYSEEINYEQLMNIYNHVLNENTSKE